ncbi:MAG TPA: Mur ligase domain-containing protein, partial [Gemmatimonadaceae bacterium]
MSGPFWTLARVSDALREQLEGSRPDRATPLAAISTDTREIQRGDCFVALVGERFDAHDFLAEAVARGAAALVVSRPERCSGLGVPVF